jgi:hypothetical protein
MSVKPKMERFKSQVLVSRITGKVPGGQVFGYGLPGTWLVFAERQLGKQCIDVPLWSCEETANE